MAATVERLGFECKATSLSGLGEYRLSLLDNFLSSLRTGDGEIDDDRLPRSFVASSDWPCAGMTFHSLEEAMQFFIGECIVGPGVHRLVWPGMSDEDLFALSSDLHQRAQALGSSIRESAVTSALFAALERCRFG